MIVYHGSYIEIPNPDLSRSRQNVDFGRGFYVTSIYGQAQRWCLKFKRRRRDGVISYYEFDERAYDELRVKRFDSYSEEWLDFIMNCRNGKDSSDYDIVIGGVANDKVFNTVELYFDGLIGKAEAIRRLKFEEPNWQLCFRSGKSLSYLEFIRGERV